MYICCDCPNAVFFEHVAMWCLHCSCYEVLEVITAFNEFIPIPMRGKGKMRQYPAKPWRSAPYLKGSWFNFVPLCCCLFRISTWLGAQGHIRDCLLYTELIIQKIEFLTACWHFTSMAWYRAECTKAEMSVSEGVSKFVNSNTSCWGGKEIPLSTYTVFCSSTRTMLTMSDQTLSSIVPNK